MSSKIRGIRSKNSKSKKKQITHQSLVVGLHCLMSSTLSQVFARVVTPGPLLPPSVSVFVSVSEPLSFRLCPSVPRVEAEQGSPGNRASFFQKKNLFYSNYDMFKRTHKEVNMYTVTRKLIYIGLPSYI